jgi:heptosyltransferase-2
MGLIDLAGWCVLGWALRLGPILRARIGRLAKDARTGPSPDRLRRILVIQLDHLGDGVLSTPLLRALKRHHPAAQLHVLCSPWNSEFFGPLAEIDRVHVLEVSRFMRCGSSGWLRHLLRAAWRLRKERFDLAIDVRGELPCAVMMWLAGARRRLGWASGGGGFLLTDSAAYIPNRPEVESRCALLRCLGVELPPEDRRPVLLPPQEARREVLWRLRALGFRGKGSHQAPWIALHLGAGSQAKRWPVYHWRELTGRLIVRHNAQLVLVGTSEDSPAAHELLRGAGGLPIHDWTGTLSVWQLAALLEQMDLLIGCDSGPAHVAAALGTPVVVLFSGANHLDQWRPRGKYVTIVRHDTACRPCHRGTDCPWADHPCMNGLTPDAVARAVENTLFEIHASRMRDVKWDELVRPDPAEVTA